jgi:hypothetical protein
MPCVHNLLLWLPPLVWSWRLKELLSKESVKNNEAVSEPSRKSPVLNQSPSSKKGNADVPLTVTNQAANGLALFAEQEEPPFPLEKKLGLKHPLRSGLLSTNEFEKIEAALVGQFREYLQANGTDASLKAYENEIKEKPDKLKVGRRGLDWAWHLGKKKTVKNTGKTQELARIDRDQDKIEKDLKQLKSWALDDVKLQDVKSIIPLRTVVREDIGRFVSLYQVSTEKQGRRFAVIADNIPEKQTELRHVLLEDRTFLRRGSLDFAGFADEGHEHLAHAIAFSLGMLDRALSTNEEPKPLLTTPTAAFEQYISRDVTAVATARDRGSAAGKKSGKGVKFKAKPSDWFIGLKFTSNENGESNIGIIYQEGKVGIELVASSKNIYVSPQVTMPGGGQILSFPLAVYEFPKSPLAADLAPHAQTPPRKEGERAPQGTPTIPSETKPKSPVPLEKNAGRTFDETQDELFAAKWRNNPALTSMLDKRGYKMQGLFDSTFWFNDHSVYFDQYSMIIDKAPTANSGEALLSFLLGDPSGFVNRSVFDAITFFKPERHQGTPKVGDLYDIDFFGPDNGTVMLVEKGKNYFIFQTIQTDKTGRHPENGAREFGFEDLPDGSIRFYMRAAASADYYVADKIGPIFQRWTWQSALDGIKEKIEFFGGKVREIEKPRHELLEQPAAIPPNKPNPRPFSIAPPMP